MFDNSTFKRRESVKDEEVNLTPMMNLFVVLIPFLLMNAAFLKLSVVNASVPTISDTPAAKGQSDKILNVNLRIEKDGFHLSGSGDNLSANELNKVRKKIKKQSGQFNYKALNQTLFNIKRQFPKGKTVMMFPDKNIEYAAIIQVMDAARWFVKASGESKQLLYPEVVLTSTVGVE